jgi:uncharacterized protein
VLESFLIPMASYTPGAEQRLAGVGHIIHGGDIGKPDVTAGLGRIAPVTAIRGNVDTGEWAEEYLDTEMVRLGGHTIHVLHDNSGTASGPSIVRS